MANLSHNVNNIRPISPVASQTNVLRPMDSPIFVIDTFPMSETDIQTRSSDFDIEMTLRREPFHWSGVPGSKHLKVIRRELQNPIYNVCQTH